MPSAATLRLQIESALAHRIPSALTPVPKIFRAVAPTGVQAVDELLDGGLPLGAMTELTGPESSGRTSVALSFVARMTCTGNVCAWVDVTDALDPESAAAAGVDLSSLLWVRCGVPEATTKLQTDSRVALSEKLFAAPPQVRGLHGGGCGQHPRDETKGLHGAVGELFESVVCAPRCAEPQPRRKPTPKDFQLKQSPLQAKVSAAVRHSKPWMRIEQALRATDLLLQAGGFRAVVLDMGSIAPEHVLRVPLATWFRYRGAAERTQASVVLMTQHTCAKSASELLLRFHSGRASAEEATVFSGIDHAIQVKRRRFATAEENVVSLRKPPQRHTEAQWQSRSTWAVVR